jgi:hypothetical protein
MDWTAGELKFDYQFRKHVWPEYGAYPFSYLWILRSLDKGIK